MDEGFQGQILALIEKAVERYGTAGKLAKASGVHAPNAPAFFAQIVTLKKFCLPNLLH